MTIVLTENSIGAGVRDSCGWAQSEALAGDSRACWPFSGRDWALRLLSRSVMAEGKHPVSNALRVLHK